jgi:hypothetical protein
MDAEHHRSEFLDYSGSWPHASLYYDELVGLYRRFSLEPDPDLESRFKKEQAQAKAKKSSKAHQLDPVQAKRQKKRELYNQRLGFPVQTKTTKNSRSASKVPKDQSNQETTSEAATATQHQPPSSMSLPAKRTPCEAESSRKKRGRIESIKKTPLTPLDQNVGRLGTHSGRKAKGKQHFDDQA